MNGYFSQTGVYIVSFIFDIYIMVVYLRFLFQWVRADFYNPISQFLVIVTDPILRPLRRVIPTYRNIDFASVVLLILLEMLKTGLIVFFVTSGGMAAPVGLFVVAAADLLQLALHVAMFTVLIRIVLSWVNPYGYRHPLTALLAVITEPVMRPFRGLIPPIGGLDISPIVLFFAIGLTQLLLVQPLRHYGEMLLR